MLGYCADSHLAGLPVAYTQRDLVALLYVQQLCQLLGGYRAVNRRVESQLLPGLSVPEVYHVLKYPGVLDCGDVALHICAVRGQGVLLYQRPGVFRILVVVQQRVVYRLYPVVVRVGVICNIPTVIIYIIILQVYNIADGILQTESGQRKRSASGNSDYGHEHSALVPEQITP